LPAQDAELILSGLQTLQQKAQNGELEYSVSNEDIHLNLEKLLIDEIGPVGGKLHTGRSRNDQVATDMHLYLKNRVTEIIELIEGFQSAIVEQA
ncbi:lyase family protein, partial [Bacillus sp. SIMBA_161]